MFSSSNNYSVFNPLFYLNYDFYGFGESDELQSCKSSNDQGSGIVVADPINELPQDLLALIFRGLNLANFRNGCQVSSKWNKQLTMHPQLGKHIVYHDNLAMSPEKYLECFGNDVIPFEEYVKHAYDSMPVNIFAILNKPCQAFAPSKKIGDTHVLFYVHESFTLNLLGELFKKCLGNTNGYEYINAGIVAQYGDQPIGKSGWVLLLTDYLPGSRNKRPPAHKSLIVDLAERADLPYEQSDLVSSIAGILAKFVISNRQVRLFGDNPRTFTRVLEQLEGFSCIVGGFGSAGPSVCDDVECYNDDIIGAAALFRCGSAEV